MFWGPIGYFWWPDYNHLILHVEWLYLIERRNYISSVVLPEDHPGAKPWYAHVYPQWWLAYSRVPNPLVENSSGPLPKILQVVYQSWANYSWFCPQIVPHPNQPDLEIKMRYNSHPQNLMELTWVDDCICNSQGQSLEFCMSDWLLWFVVLLVPFHGQVEALKLIPYQCPCGVQVSKSKMVYRFKPYKPCLIQALTSQSIGILQHLFELFPHEFLKHGNPVWHSSIFFFNYWPCKLTWTPPLHNLPLVVCETWNVLPISSY